MKSGHHLMERESSKGIKMRFMQKNRSFYVMLAILVTAVFIILLNMYELHSMRLDHEWHHQELKKFPEKEAISMSVDQKQVTHDKPVVWIQGGGKNNNDHHGRYSYLKHVHVVFERMGFHIDDKSSDWVVMWVHDYPFVTYEKIVKDLKPYQRVNHFPGSGYITNKVTLAQTSLEFIPKAFEMPSKKKQFLEYSQKHVDMSWVQKSNKHRGIEVKDRHSLDLSKAGSFIQRYISNPFLIDGHKFDIGIYTIITGIDPLRVYIVDGDALFRFCPKKYYPFDDSILEKYVVGDNYLPMWEVPSLKETFSSNGFTFINTFNEYLRRNGLDSKSVWNKMKVAIRQVVLAKEKDLIKSVKNYRSKRNFFEIVRFDFVLDDQLNVFLMEANMSPNLSSDHFPRNARLYEHVVFNALNLVGLGHFTNGNTQHFAYYEDSILVSLSDIRVFPDYCETEVCKGSCKRIQCKLCNKCLTKSMEIDIKIAYLEHIERGTSRRVFPPVMTQSYALKWQPDSLLLDGLNEKNKLMFLWFIGKCRIDPAWCH